MMDLDDLRNVNICRKCMCLYMPMFEYIEQPPHSYDLELGNGHCSRCQE